MQELEQDPANPPPAALPWSPYLLRLPKALPGSQGFPFLADLVLQETLLPTLSGLPAPAQTNTFITPNSRAVTPQSFRDVNPLPLTSSPAPFPELLCIHHPQHGVSPVSPPRGDSPAPRAQPQAPSCGNACDKHKALPSTPKLSFCCRVPPPHFSSTDFLPLAKGLGRRTAPAARCAGRAELASAACLAKKRCCWVQSQSVSSGLTLEEGALLSTAGQEAATRLCSPIPGCSRRCLCVSDIPVVLAAGFSSRLPCLNHPNLIYPAADVLFYFFFSSEMRMISVDPSGCY